MLTQFFVPFSMCKTPIYLITQPNKTTLFARSMDKKNRLIEHGPEIKPLEQPRKSHTGRKHIHAQNPVSLVARPSAHTTAAVPIPSFRVYCGPRARIKLIPARLAPLLAHPHIAIVSVEMMTSYARRKRGERRKIYVEIERERKTLHDCLVWVCGAWGRVRGNDASVSCYGFFCENRGGN